jgi:hypothetical protein
MTGPRYCDLKFYKTLNPKPLFTFDNGVEKIGNCLIDAGKDYPLELKERELKVTMKFGGTFIDVQAIHVKSGNKVETTLKFI